MKKVILSLAILCTLAIGCTGDPGVQYTYRSPEDAGDGLAVGTLEDVSVN